MKRMLYLFLLTLLSYSLLEGFSTVEEWYNEGNRYYVLGEYAEAIKCYDKALGINPYDAEVLESKAGALHYLGKYEESNECYDKANKARKIDIILR